jgi:hypothetical protein
MLGRVQNRMFGLDASSCLERIKSLQAELVSDLFHQIHQWIDLFVGSLGKLLLHRNINAAVVLVVGAVVRE